MKGQAMRDIPENEIGDGPVDPKYVRMMNTFAGVLDEIFNNGSSGQDRQVGFALMIFPFHSQEGRCNYVSNASRPDVVRLLADQLRAFHEQEEAAEQTRN